MWLWTNHLFKFLPHLQVEDTVLLKERMWTCPVNCRVLAVIESMHISYLTLGKAYTIIPCLLLGTANAINDDKKQDIFTKHHSPVPARSSWRRGWQPRTQGHMEVVVPSQVAAPQKGGEVRLHLPGDTSPRQMAGWELEYQLAGKQEARLQLP